VTHRWTGHVAYLIEAVLVGVFGGGLGLLGWGIWLEVFVNGGQDRVLVVVVAAVAMVFCASLGAWVVLMMLPMTVVIDDHGVELRQWRREKKIGWKDIKSIGQSSGGYLAGPPFITIYPRKRYLDRVGTKPPSPWTQNWMINGLGFTNRQFREMAAVFADYGARVNVARATGDAG